MASRVQQIRFSEPLRNARLLSREEIEAAALRQQEERERARFEQGRLEGERSLGEQLVRQRSELIAIQDGLFESLRQAIPSLIRQAEPILVEIALEAARKVVAQFPITADLIEASIREAVSEVEDQTELRLLLHPEDLALLQRINSPTLLSTRFDQSLQVQASTEVSRGGCLVRTRFGTVDGRRETKWEVLKQAILE